VLNHIVALVREHPIESWAVDLRNLLSRRLPRY